MAKKKKPVRKAGSKGVRVALRRAHSRTATGHTAGLPEHLPTPREASALRRLFWHDVVREMLTHLSALMASKPEVFDGRVGVLTRGGKRLGIAEVSPLFACTLPGAPTVERTLSTALESTVFRIRTPEGEVYTIPLHEIWGVHSVTEELIKQLEDQAMTELASKDDRQPFGFAAFTQAAGKQAPMVPPQSPGPTGTSDAAI